MLQQAFLRSLILIVLLAPLAQADATGEIAAVTETGPSTAVDKDFDARLRSLEKDLSQRKIESQYFSNVMGLPLQALNVTISVIGVGLVIIGGLGVFQAYHFVRKARVEWEKQLRRFNALEKHHRTLDQKFVEKNQMLDQMAREFETKYEDYVSSIKIDELYHRMRIYNHQRNYKLSNEIYSEATVKNKHIDDNEFILQEKAYMMFGLCRYSEAIEAYASLNARELKKNAKPILNLCELYLFSRNVSEFETVFTQNIYNKTVISEYVGAAQFQTLEAYFNALLFYVGGDMEKLQECKHFLEKCPPMKIESWNYSDFKVFIRNEPPTVAKNLLIEVVDVIRNAPEEPLQATEQG